VINSKEKVKKRSSGIRQLLWLTRETIFFREGVSGDQHGFYGMRKLAIGTKDLYNGEFDPGSG
jgi:hypothetical protein